MLSSDKVKKQEIIDQLTWNDSVNADNIQVKVSGNTALLEGIVPNYASKISAAINANMIRGINYVENNLKVELPVKSNLPDDKEITENIMNTLKWQSNVSTENLKVESNEGIVTLSGTTETLWGKNQAEDIVNGIHGVIGVVNKLDVNKISVDVNKGTVHLTGAVANFPIKKEAIDIATYTKGVSNVIGDITIE